MSKNHNLTKSQIKVRYLKHMNLNFNQHKWNRWFFKTLLLFLLSNITKAQNLQYIQYTTEDGLLHNIGHCLVQDSVGFLWIGTAIGLSRFDGVNFFSF